MQPAEDQPRFSARTLPSESGHLPCPSAVFGFRGPRTVVALILIPAVVLLGGLLRPSSLAQSTAIPGIATTETSANAPAASPPADTERPVLAGVWNEGPTTVVVRYSEPVAAATALDRGHYALDPAIAIGRAEAGVDPQSVRLTTAALSFGTNYTLTVSGVTDLASPPNTILPDSKVTFLASEYVASDVGSPVLTGSTVRVPGGADVTGGGRTIGGTSDQFQFGWQERIGNFDLETRVADVTVPDPFVHAGLMARDVLDGNARFGAVFASSAQLGCFFESRVTAGAASTTAVPRDGFPVNFPNAWLRLQRTGGTIYGYASFDGVTWTQLGSANIPGLPSRLFVGFAVTGDTEKSTAVARFRDFGPTRSSTLGAAVVTREPVGPSARTTGMILGEIMYHPPSRPDGRNLEFVEVHNARSVPEDLTGWRLTGDIEYRFPDGFRMAAGETVVVAASPNDLRAVYGVTNVLGPFDGSLANEGGTLELRNNADAIRLRVEFSNRPPWPVAADGAGHSLVLARPSYGENEIRAWAASELRGGSPGVPDPIVPAPETAVVINEFLAHTDEPQLDFIELHNRSAARLDLSGCILTDDPSTNRFRVPAGTFIEPRGFLAWDQTQLGFNLRSAGETIYLVSSNQTRVLDAIRFGGQENGVATGRAPDGSDTLRRLIQPTPGSRNASWRTEAVVINEIMYHPITLEDDDEYVELHNRGSESVDLSGWRFESGIDFTFPKSTVLPAGGYAVVARNTARLISRYPRLSTDNTYGDFAGSLRDGGERLALSKPDQVVSTNEFGLRETNVIHIVVSEVTYGDGGRWARTADGAGASLELIDPDADLLRAANWAGSDETGKAPWTTVSVTGRVDNANGQANRLHVSSLGGGEYLIDDIEVFREGSTNVVANGDFENGTTGWTFHGNHGASGLATSGAAAGTACLHLRGQGDGDTGPNTVRNALRTTIAANSTTTIRAKVRWLTGWPQVLFRLHGNGLELAADLAVPPNLGTPGEVNSRRVPNAGPAIFDVTHAPALPAVSEAVRVTCRVSDPDGVAALRLQYRIDPATTLTTVVMRDDGTNGDESAGDGLFTARLPGQTSGRLVAFRITGTDDAASPATSVFPALAPAEECLIRWGDTVPFGTFAHYHLWSTEANRRARGNALNNTWRDGTLVYNGYRVIYNTGFRDKGSPFHGGSGDIAAATPADEPLLGVDERVFASTGNGGSEATGIRSQLASWYGQQLGIPYLHGHYMRLYLNGGLFREISEDLEQPNHDHGRRWFPDAPEGDLYKIAVWFEFDDANSGFQSTSATLQRFTTLNGQYKLARYRWNWQRRSNDGDANNLSQLLDLVTVMNDSSSAYVGRVLEIADLEQWMRVFCYDYAMGNWDAWTYNVGQNMYIYKPDGLRWALMPWDIDFVFGLGDGTSSALRGGGQDPTMVRAYGNPTFQRMNWRAYKDTIEGPFLAANFQPQIDARRSVLLKNGITGLQDPRSLTTWINARRTYIANALNNADAKVFEITTNAGSDLDATTPTTALEGTAPIAVATIEVNGVPYPVTWPTVRTFRLTVPLTQATNTLVLVGKDRRGNPVPGATDTLVVRYPGAVEKPEDFVVINEVHYDPASGQAGSTFVELYNRSAVTPFDLTGYRLDGLGYTFPPGALIQPNAYLVLAANRVGFAAVYGGTTPVFDEFAGALDKDGERLALVRPAVGTAPETLVSDLRYWDRLPWPTNAAGLGPSLQLRDPIGGSWRVANWAATATNDVNRATPGRVNAVAQQLEPFPALWINEVQPQNVGGPVDGAGDRDPWIELHNAGPTTLDLSAYYLTDDYTVPNRWKFPAGVTLGPGQYLVVWADGEPAESRPGEWHTNFRLAPATGAVALVRPQGAPLAPAVLDFVEYRQLAAGRTFGSYPDGEPRRRRLFVHPTPGAANNPEIPPVFVRINELMAANTRTVSDPADDDYDDWFELHNAGPNSVDLSTYTLTDDLADPTRFAIPPGTILPAGGFLLVWADDETAQNGPGRDLHVNFRLSQEGEQLGLFAPDGTLVDGFAFGALTNDVSLGRFPDGGELPLYELASPTPRGPNSLAGANRPPVFATVPDQAVPEGTRLVFEVRATDPDEGQSVRYSLGDDAPPGAVIGDTTGIVSWTPSEAEGPGRHTFFVRASDDGSPSRLAATRVNVDVSEVNQPPVLAATDGLATDEGTLFTHPFRASDPDLPPNELVFSLGPDAPSGASMAENGEFSWVPEESLGGSVVTFTVQVTDRGVPPLSDTRRVAVEVREIPNPPDMPLISPQTVDEGTAFRFRVVAIDPDTPPSPLRFTIESGPEDARIDPATGEIFWLPTEETGPTNAIFVVRATELEAPFQATSRTFSVTVNESNQAPLLGALPDQVISEGSTLALRALATDADLPPQSLTFSFAGDVPAGMTIDPTSGWILWPVDPDHGSATNDIVVRVADDGPGALGATRNLRVVVVPQPHLVINEIMYRPTAALAEFVEVINNSSRRSLSLGGVKLVGTALEFVFPNGTTLAPGAMTVVVGNRAGFTAAYGTGLPVAGEWNGLLDPAGDTLRLVETLADRAEVVLDEVRFSASAPWPAAANGRGGSLQLRDPLRDNSRLANWDAAAGLASQSSTLLVMTNEWRYHQTGEDLGTAWRAPDYPDASWPSGRALLFVENANLPAPKNTPLTLGVMTYYFRTTFDYSGPVAGLRLSANTILDDAAVVYLNGQELFRVGFNESTEVDAATPSDRGAVGDAALEGPFTPPGNLLRFGRNTVAAEVHQNSLGSSDIVWGMDLVVEATSAPATPGRTNSLALPLPDFPPVWINEVQTRNLDGPLDNAGEREAWVELVNTGPLPVSLDGWYLTDNGADLRKWPFPAGSTLGAGSFTLLWGDGEPAESVGPDLHLSFLILDGHPVALVRDQPGGPAIVDYLVTPFLPPNGSYGSLPDGQAFRRETFARATPRAPNAAIPTPDIVGIETTADGGIRFGWLTVPGVTYRVEAAAAVEGAPWMTLVEETASATAMTFTDSPNPGPRFYRVVVP